MEYNTINELIELFYSTSKISKLFEGYINVDIGEFNIKNITDLMYINTKVLSEMTFNQISLLYLNFISILNEISNKNLIIIANDFGNCLTISEQTNLYNNLIDLNNTYLIFNYTSYNYYSIECLENTNLVNENVTIIEDSKQFINELNLQYKLNYDIINLKF
ncbi:MAG: hypothetical protein ACK5NF_02640 [Bacilli bacterium]